MGGQDHGLRRFHEDDDQPHAVQISYYRQNTWTEVIPDHPGGFQWTGPGIYVIAVERESKTQVAEVRITLAHDTDGNDNSTPMILAIAHALRRVYSQEKP